MSSKTPNEQPKGTASALNFRSKNYLKVVIAVIALIFVVRILLGFIYDSANTLTAPNGSITVEVVDTIELRTLGLSGRTGIAKDEGMLFVFEEVSQQNCFWMKDMQFSIDMIWLDENKSVINVIPNVAPESYPESFCPAGPAKYGLEIAKDQSEQLGIVAGENLFW